MWFLSLFVGALPALLKGIVEVLVPLLKGLVEGFVELCKLWYEGIKDILDNFATIVTVLTLVLVPVGYVKWEANQEIQAIHQDYRAKWEPKKKTTKPITPKPTEWKWWS